MNINYSFKNPQLLNQALTHKSHDKENNQRLEFLGDAILGGIIAHHLYHLFPDAPEGQLSLMKSKLIQRKTLVDIALKLAIKPHIICQNKDIANQEATLADTIEALIAAIFLDSDITTCQSIIIDWFQPIIDNESQDLSEKDHKTKLQEYCQKHRIELPVYTLIKTTGPEHKQLFHIHCQIDSLEQESSGQGKTVRSAEQDAAKELLNTIQ